MRDELEAPFLDEWLHDTEVAPPDPQEGARRVASQLPHTRQVGWRLPFRVFERKAHPPTAADTTDHEPSPIPATNGHTPTVIGRTQSMFSPAKAITAGAFVFAIGGVLLMAQPFDQQSSVPGASTEAPPSFSGRIELGSAADGGWSAASTVDEPRLAGDAYFSLTESFIEDDIVVRSITWRIENEVGAWDGSYSHFALEAGATDRNGQAVVTVPLVGEGAYDGLVALTEFDPNQGFGWEIRGLIVEADEVPAFPPPAQAR